MVSVLTVNPSNPACAPLLAYSALLVNIINSRLEHERREQAAREQESGARGDNIFDIVIVGGGGAGCVLARRLSEIQNWRVLLLERGGSQPQEANVPGYEEITMETDITQNIYAVPEPQNCAGVGCEVQTGRVLGGGTVINGMMYVRGNRYDYDKWANYTGDDGWSYDKVMPYFKRLENNLDRQFAYDSNYHDMGGPLPVSQLPYRPYITTEGTLPALRSLGYKEVDANAESQLGYMVLQSQARGGERWSTNRAYLDPVRWRSNLQVRTFARVTRVLISDSVAPPRAEGVEYEDAGGVLRQVRARLEVVVSAGALHTPQVLLLSGIGPKDHLQEANITLVADLPVGENLMDHVFACGLEVNCKECLQGPDWPRRLVDIQLWQRSGPPRPYREGALAGKGTLEVGAFFHTETADDLPASVPNIQMIFAGNYKQADGTTCTDNMDNWHENVLFPSPGILNPRSSGTVRLNISAPHAEPVVTFGYLTDQRDVDTPVSGLRATLNITAAMEGTGKFALNRTQKAGCEDSDFGSDEYLACLARTFTHTLWHYAGTAKMGRADDETAVVDSKLLVRGVDALRVVDTSVFPFLTSGNTMVPVIMLAERAADMIKQSHGQAADPLPSFYKPRK